MQRKHVIILGAAGRDFHDFNVFYRKNPQVAVVAFTANQIPGISGRKYPAKLSGKLYPKGISIFEEKKLPELIRKLKADEVVLAYSDLPHEEVMHKASIALSCGASFTLLGPKETMLSSRKPVVAVCAVRTGSGKSQTTRKIARLLQKHGKNPVIVRHPMPYGVFEKQEVERFDSLKDLKKYNCTIEEREEFEPLINEGFTVYAGVDYEKILRKVEKEADVIIWDGGNNDFSFFKPDLTICVADPLRSGHEMLYHPGEASFRMADVVLINKMNSAHKPSVQKILQNLRAVNPKALVIEADSEIFAEEIGKTSGKKVVVVEDGPSVTHGGLPFGVAFLAAKKYKARIASVEKHAVGSIKETFKKFPHLKNVLPAMGYSAKQLRELEHTINKTPADFVLSGTPIDLSLILKVNKPVIHVSYRLKEISKLTLEKVLKKKGFL